jgi:hypothetical protein
MSILGNGTRWNAKEKNRWRFYKIWKKNNTGPRAGIILTRKRHGERLTVRSKFKWQYAIKVHVFILIPVQSTWKIIGLVSEFDVSSILTNRQQRVFGRKKNKDVLKELQVDDRITFDSSQKDGCPS